MNLNSRPLSSAPYRVPRARGDEPKRIDAVRSNGGSVRIRFADIDAETSAARAIVREAEAEAEGKTPRPVPLETSAKGYNNGLPTMIQLLKDYKEDPKVTFKVVDNNIDFRKPVPVFEKDESGYRVYNQNLFDKMVSLDYIKTKDGKYERTDRITEQDLRARFPELEQRAQGITQRKGAENRSGDGRSAGEISADRPNKGKLRPAAEVVPPPESSTPTLATQATMPPGPIKRSPRARG